MGRGFALVSTKTSAVFEIPRPGRRSELGSLGNLHIILVFIVAIVARQQPPSPCKLPGPQSGSQRVWGLWQRQLPAHRHKHA